MKIDLERINEEYERLQKRNHPGLLSLPRVIALEEAKLRIKNNYLDHISLLKKNKILQFNNSDCDYNYFVEICKKDFGDLNLALQKEEDKQEILILTFNYCLITITAANQKIHYKINTFWDN